MTDGFNAKLDTLKKMYVEKLRALIPEFELIILSEKIDVKEIYQRVHKISGTAGMYGLAGISDLASQFEEYLKPIKDDLNLENQNDIKKKTSEFFDKYKDMV
jgi:HPt (histidine-containing phosphotransfer) domain-containing protein